MSVVAKRLDGLRCHLVWRWASAQATVFDGDPATPEKRAHPPHPIFSPCLLWPNGWMDQDATWYGSTPRLRRRGVAGPPERGTAPVFGSCLLWPNGLMDEDTTWYGSRPLPRSHCIKRGPSSPRKGHSSPPPLFGACLLYMFIVATVAHLSYC